MVPRNPLRNEALGLMVRVAAERYAKGETMAELAEVYGVSEPTIWRALAGPFRGKHRRVRGK